MLLDRSYFFEFQVDFKRHPLYQNMLDCTELTKWHREDNVGIHTNMVISEYLKTIHSERGGDAWCHDTMLGAMACLFHDVGKPKAKEMKWSEERGHYPSFHGHELMSTRLFEDYMVTNWWLLGRRYDPDDIYKIGWLIQNHLPYKIKKPAKLMPILVTAQRLFNDPHLLDKVLMSDQLGRIADAADENHAAVREWIEQLHVMSTTQSVGKVDPNKPTVYVMIAPSSSGKSTVAEKLKDKYDCTIYSNDELRLQWYDPQNRDYDIAWKLACDDNTFVKRSHDFYLDLLRNGGNIVADSMHLSPKSRNFVCLEAVKKGYNVIAVLVPISLQELIDRSVSRLNRTIPIPIIINMYNSIQYPSIGTCFHDVIISGNNLHVSGNRLKKQPEI